jgi:hypothetical protein
MVSPVSPTNPGYRKFCLTAPDLPIFAQPWYLDACVGEGEEWSAVMTRENGQIRGAMPFVIKRKGPFRYATMPAFVKWLGPYIVPEFRGNLRQEHAILDDLIFRLPKLASFKQNFYPTLTNWLPFYWKGYQQTTYYTYRLNGIQNLAEVEAGLSLNVRRDIRQARRQVRVVHDLPVEQFYAVNKLSFDRQKLPVPYSWEQFQRHDAALAAHGARQLFFAVDAQERIHSVAYLIWDKQAAYYHLAGDDPDLRRSGAGLLLAWECIRYASEVLGLTCFDFEGSMLPGVERIRTRFGAVQTPYFFVSNYDSKLFRLLEKLKS